MLLVVCFTSVVIERLGEKSHLGDTSLLTSVDIRHLPTPLRAIEATGYVMKDGKRVYRWHVHVHMMVVLRKGHGAVWQWDQKRRKEVVYGDVKPLLFGENRS